MNGRNDGHQVDDNGDIVVPEPKPPSKPEVVFVKYNNEADAQRAISEIQTNYNNQQGATVSVIGAGNSAGSFRSGVSGGSTGSSFSGSSGGSSIGLSTGGSSSGGSGYTSQSGKSSL